MYLRRILRRVLSGTHWRGLYLHSILAIRGVALTWFEGTTPFFSIAPPLPAWARIKIFDPPGVNVDTLHCAWFARKEKQWRVYEGAPRRSQANGTNHKKIEMPSFRDKGPNGGGMWNKNVSIHGAISKHWHTADTRWADYTENERASDNRKKIPGWFSCASGEHVHRLLRNEQKKIRKWVCVLSLELPYK